jgi:hypothetical protein
MRKSSKQKTRRKPYRRSGVAALDYMLVLGVILPLVAFIMVIGPKMIGLVYSMISLLISWPFM